MTRHEKLEGFREYVRRQTSNIEEPTHRQIAELAYAYGYLASLLTDDQVDRLPR